MRSKITITVIISLVLLSITTCKEVTGIIADIPPSEPTDLPPFVITKPVFEIYERPYYFKYAGIVFKFLNKAEETVDKITVSFLLFDAKTEDSPFIGSNKFEISKQDIVLPGENKEIIINLDPFIYIAPTEPYLIDLFYIYEVHYANGANWQDQYGKYRVRD